MSDDVAKNPQNFKPLTKARSLALALSYTARHPGRRLHPVKPGAKYPPLIPNNLKDASSDEKQIRAWADRYPGCNWGLALKGDNVIVVDVDQKPGKNGEATFADLDLEYTFPMPTEEVRTPSGGRHLYYEGPHVFALGEHGFGPDIDSPNYVLIAGCRFADGSRYEATSTGPTLPAPSWFYDVLSAAKAKHGLSDAGEMAIETDKPANVEWAIAFLKEDAEPAIEGKGGDFQTLKIAMGVRDKGISPELCLALMLEYYNDRCVPPWDVEGLELKVKNAYSYASQSRGGDRTAEMDFEEDRDFDADSLVTEGADDVDSTGTVKSDPRPEPISKDELRKGGFPRTSYSVADLIMEGNVNLLYGDGGTGKTTLAIQIAVAVSDGRPIFGRETIKAPVLLVLAEDVVGEVQPRIAAAVEYLKADWDTLDLRAWCLPGHSISLARVSEMGQIKLLPFYRDLECKLAERPGSFVVLDSLADIAQMGEADRLGPNAFLKDVLGGLARKHKATLLVLGHPSKKAMEDGSGYSGSTGFRNAVRNMLALKAEKATPFVLLERLKNNYGAKGAVTTRLLWSDGIFVPASAVDVKTQEEPMYKATLGAIYELIDKGIQVCRNNQGDGQTPRDVARLVNEQNEDFALTYKDVDRFMKRGEQYGDLRYVSAFGKTKAHWERAGSAEDDFGHEGD
ncbi:AAA family ATPase [Bradyrhizobium genosp. P]|uniref:AAA family ATPase n=1 Tax=Bradyrhizobium genosp. P TaxID=83641 RepID=UPI003CEFE321